MFETEKHNNNPTEITARKAEVGSGKNILRNIWTDKDGEITQKEG